MDEVWQMIDKKSLFKLSWGLRGKAASESEEEHEVTNPMEDSNN